MSVATVPRYDSTAVGSVGKHAVVIGGSFAGLFAARVLADGFEQVTVFERDPLPDEPVARDGAPQSYHPHGLLEAARATTEDLFPGYGEILFSEGGLLGDASTAMKVYSQGEFLHEETRRREVYTASRPLFEHVLRERARSLTNIVLQGSCQFGHC